VAADRHARGCVRGGAAGRARGCVRGRARGGPRASPGKWPATRLSVL